MYIYIYVYIYIYMYIYIYVYIYIHYYALPTFLLTIEHILTRFLSFTVGLIMEFYA